jgi:hypothetical protein
VVHFPTEVQPALVQVDPAIVSDREDVLQAIARMLDGQALPEVLGWAEGEAPELARVLAQAAASADLYRLETALSAAKGILGRMELRGIEARILTINREIHRCETTGDKSSYVSLVRELAGLYARQAALKQAVNRKAGVEA